LGTFFEVRVRAFTADGSVKASETGLEVAGATDVMLILAAGTSFNGYQKESEQGGRRSVRTHTLEEIRGAA
jgi:alpha-L-fucosidase 2